MANPCTICHHPERTAIEKALLEGATGCRKLAQSFGVSADALFRHRRKHLPPMLARAVAARPAAVHRPVAVDPATDEHAQEIAKHQQAVEADKERHAIDVFHQLRAINATCLEVVKQARADGKHSILLQAVDRIARQIEIQARLLGQIDDGQTVNVLVMPEWQQLREVILDALRPFPEARLAVARGLQGLTS